MMHWARSAIESNEINDSRAHNDKHNCIELIAYNCEEYKKPRNNSITINNLSVIGIRAIVFRILQSGNFYTLSLSHLHIMLFFKVLLQFPPLYHSVNGGRFYPH